MSTLIWDDFETESGVRVTMSYREPYVTEGLNRKIATSMAPGVYRGWKLDTHGSDLTVTVVADSTFSDHVAIQQTRPGTDTGYSITISRTGGDFSLALTAVASSTVVLALSGVYTIGADTKVQILAFTILEWEAFTIAEQSEFVVLGTVVVPASGTIPAANITYDRRSYAWEKKAPEAVEWVPLIKNSSFEEGQLAQSDELAAYFWQSSITTPSTPASTWQLSNNSSYKNTGSRGLLFTYATGDGAVTGQVVQYFNVTVTAGDRIRISAYVNGVQAASAGSIYLRLAFTDSAGTVTNQDLDLTSEFPTSGFEKFEKTFRVAAGVTALKSAALYLNAVQFLSAAAAFAVDDFQVFTERASTTSENVLASRLGGVLGASRLMLEAPGAFPGASAAVFGYDSAGSGAVTLQSRAPGSNLGLRLLNGATQSGDLTTSKLSTLIGGPTSTPVAADSLHIHGDTSNAKLRKNGVISGGDPTDGGGLNLAVAAGYFYDAGYQKYTSATTLTLPNNTTSYVYYGIITDSILQTTTESTAYTWGIPVAKVVTSGGVITSITDIRRFIDEVDNSIRITVGPKGNFRTLQGAVSWVKANPQTKNYEIILLDNVVLTSTVTINVNYATIRSYGAVLSWTFSGPALELSGDYVTLDGLRFDASSAALDCVNGGSANLTIRNCLVQGTPRSLFATTGSNQRVVIEGNKVLATTYGLNINAASSVFIRNNEFLHTGAFVPSSYGIYIVNTNTAANYSIEGNTIRQGDTSSWQCGIYFLQNAATGATDILVSNNIVEYETADANNTYQLAIQAGVSSNTRAKIIGNSLITAATSLTNVLRLDGGSSVIDANTIRAPSATAGTGIYVSGPGNLVTDCVVVMESLTSGNGIFTHSSAVDTIISSNKILLNAACADPILKINGNTTKVTGNYLGATNTYAIENSGTAITIDSNTIESCKYGILSLDSTITGNYITVSEVVLDLTGTSRVVGNQLYSTGSGSGGTIFWFKSGGACQISGNRINVTDATVCFKCGTTVVMSGNYITASVRSVLFNLDVGGQIVSGNYIYCVSFDSGYPIIFNTHPNGGESIEIIGNYLGVNQVLSLLRLNSSSPPANEWNKVKFVNNDVYISDLSGCVFETADSTNRFIDISGNEMTVVLSKNGGGSGSFTKPAPGANVTLTVAPGTFSASDAGKKVYIVDASTPNNDGIFNIVSATTSSITYDNTLGGTTEPLAAGTTWNVTFNFSQANFFTGRLYFSKIQNNRVSVDGLPIQDPYAAKRLIYLHSSSTEVMVENNNIRWIYTFNEYGGQPIFLQAEGDQHAIANNILIAGGGSSTVPSGPLAVKLVNASYTVIEGNKISAYTGGNCMAVWLAPAIGCVVSNNILYAEGSAGGGYHIHIDNGSTDCVVIGNRCIGTTVNGITGGAGTGGTMLGNICSSGYNIGGGAWTIGGANTNI